MIKKNRLYIFLIGLYICLPKIFFSQILYPTDISGIAGWYSSDSIISTNGTQIPNWNDLSGNNNHLTQPSVLNQGTFFTNQLNNKPCIRLDGVNSFYSFTDSVDFRTIVIVGKANVTQFTDYRGLFGGPLSSLLIGGYLINGIGGTSNLAQGTNSSIFSKMLRNNVSTLPTGDFSPLNNYWIGDFEFNTNRKQTSDFGRIDNGNQPGRYWIGDVFEIIIYNKALSNSESNDIFNYLSQKYAPSVILPPDITVSNSLCDTVITTNSNFESYNWSTGATTPTISVYQTGKYWVTATNVFGKISSDTILVSYPGHFLSQNATLCFGDSIVWNTNLPKSQYTFQWQDNSPDSVYTIKQAGQYFVKVVDGNGCIVNTNTITITQDNFSTITSLGPDINLCSGNLITLTSGSSPSLTYTWSTGSVNDSLLVTVGGQYSVIVTNTNNCVAKDTIIVTVIGFAPTANFSSNIGCINQIVSFTDLSIPPSGNSISNYAWSFGDTASPTNTSTASNPLHTYSNTGTYTVNLTVTTNTGCAQSIVKTINVYPVPTSTFAIGISCQNDTTAFLNQSTGITGYSIASSYWNFGDASPTATTNISSPKHVFVNSTTYTSKLVVTNSAGCKDSIYKTVFVNAEVKANFTSGPACLNNITSFQSTSTIPPAPYQPTYLWNFGNSTANTPNPIKTYTNSGVYSVTLYVDGTNGCTSSITKFVNVYLPPIASFSIPSFCAKDTVNIINFSNPQSGIMSSYNWRLNNTSFSAIQSPTLSLVNAGNYSIRLTTTNSFGCKDSTTHALTVFPLPLVDFSTIPAAFYYLNEPVNFIPSNGNANSYLWNMNGASTYTILSPTETFNTEGSYNVSLNLKDENGCKGTKTKNITVNKRSLDLAILNVSTLKDNNGFMTVVADLANYGSVPIGSIKMHYQISDGGNIIENWSGTLNPNSFYTYTFNSVSASVQNSSNNITCVDIEKVNSIVDDNVNNNSFCNSLNADGINISNPLPNPTNGDIILPITLNRDLDYTIAIYNSIGQTQYEETTKKGVEGLNFVTLNTSSYARGCYIIKIMLDGKVFIKKFIKLSFE